MNRRRIADVWVAALIAGAAGLCGCQTQGKHSAEFGVASADYARAIETARDVLQAARFEIDRVDAASGVITTQPRASAGLLTPWDDDQSTMGQEVEDAVNSQRRRVRITFEPAAVDRPQGAGTQAAPRGDALDLRRANLALTARVEVFVDRVRRPGTRLETESIRTTTEFIDPALRDRQMSPEYETTVDHDELLAGRIAARIRERMGI